MANPFDVEVASPLQALLLGQQSYKAAQEGQQQDAVKQARSQASSLYQSGDTKGALATLLGANDLDGATKVAAISKSLAPPENSADIQGFKMAQAQGFKGTILDYLKEKAAAGASRTNVNVSSGEKEFDKAVGKDYGETFVGLNKAARDSSGAINNLNLMEGLTKDPRFYSGTGAELVTQAKKAATSLGIADADSAAPNELFKKISQKAVLDAAGGSLGTGFSNADRAFLEGTVPNIVNTPEGNRQIIGIARRVEQRKQEVAKFARDYATKHGGRIDAGFDSALSEWTAQNPAFPNAAASSPVPSKSNKTSTGIQWSVE